MPPCAVPSSDEIERLGKQLAAYKRVSRIELTDEPLPKTPLQKVARGRIEPAYEFSFEKWLASIPASETS